MAKICLFSDRVWSYQIQEEKNLFSGFEYGNECALSLLSELSKRRQLHYVVGICKPYIRYIAAIVRSCICSWYSRHFTHREQRRRKEFKNGGTTFAQAGAGGGGGGKGESGAVL